MVRSFHLNQMTSKPFGSSKEDTDYKRYSVSSFVFLLCRFDKFPKETLYGSLARRLSVQQGEPKNPSLSTWIFSFVLQAQHHLTEGQHHFEHRENIIYHNSDIKTMPNIQPAL